MKARAQKTPMNHYGHDLEAPSMMWLIIGFIATSVVALLGVGILMTEEEPKKPQRTFIVTDESSLIITEPQPAALPQASPRSSE